GIIFDEAHCLSSWGSTFRPEYHKLGQLRSLLFPDTAFYATSATMPPCIYKDVCQVLGMKSATTVAIQIETDRPNIQYTCRTLACGSQGFESLDFLIPEDVQSPEDIPLTLVYLDSITDCKNAAKHLWQCLPDSMKGWDGDTQLPLEECVVSWFTSVMLRRFKDNAMSHFKAGSLRILCCTDAAGMGCDIPNVMQVVQYHVPTSLEALVQHFGHCVRNPELISEAYLLVNTSV
ncbi:hypothetical protein BOTBODRAFT_72662, partial [Botryobasidium botryosum FD-172 SS1]